MSSNQWNVFGLLLVLFALEALRNKNVSTWLRERLAGITKGVSK